MLGLTIMVWRKRKEKKREGRRGRVDPQQVKEGNVNAVELLERM